MAQLAFEKSPMDSTANNSIIKDLTPPHTDLLPTLTGNYIYGPATRIKFEIIEKESGWETTYFQIADLPYMKSDGRQMMPHDLNDGEYTMQYYSVDKEGNQEQVQEKTIYLDKHGPKVTPYFNITPTSFIEGIPVFSGSVDLIAEIVDNNVGVQKVTYRINEGPIVESDELHTIDFSKELSQLESETIIIEIKAYDTFYNISKTVIAFKTKE